MKLWRVFSLTMLLIFMLLPCTYAVTPNISVLTLDEIPPTPKGIHHYLLVCVDQWIPEKCWKGNTDGMVLVTVDEVSGRIIVTSFVRDTLVLQPNGEKSKLTEVFKSFGIDGLLETINRHFGLRIEKYILMNWTQVVRIVDILGGVDLQVTGSEASFLKHYPISPTSTTPAMNRAGTYHFNGRAAMIYMRCRSATALNGDRWDYGRTYRARLVLYNIADSLKDISQDRAYELFREIFDSLGDPSIFFHTNVSMADLLDAFQMAFALKGTPVERFRVPIDGTHETYFLGISCTQLADCEVNRAALHDFLFDQSYVVIE
ncbi:MAG: LCP family protein [Christensenellales bacterium]|jgi:LCP family protein required for cell wall assembly